MALTKTKLLVFGGLVLIGGAIAAVLTLSDRAHLDSRQVGVLTLYLSGQGDGANDIDQAAAVNISLNSIATQAASNGAPVVGGYTLTKAYHAFGLRKAIRGSQTFASFDQPKDVWVLEFSAAPQGGWKHVSAVAIVDARTGKIEEFSEDKHN